MHLWLLVLLLFLFFNNTLRPLEGLWLAYYMLGCSNIRLLFCLFVFVAILLLLDNERQDQQLSWSISLIQRIIKLRSVLKIPSSVRQISLALVFIYLLLNFIAHGKARFEKVAF